MKAVKAIISVIIMIIIAPLIVIVVLAVLNPTVFGGPLTSKPFLQYICLRS